MEDHVHVPPGGLPAMDHPSLLPAGDELSWPGLGLVLHKTTRNHHLDPVVCRAYADFIERKD